MDANFSACFNATLTYEGGYSDNPHDPGGATYRGVTQRVYDGYRLTHHLGTQWVRRMTDAECEDIYRTQYWIAARCPDLPPGLDLCQYDEAVNTGPVEAARLLQQALGVPVDGVFGFGTMGAVQSCKNVPDLIHKVCAVRLSFYHRLKSWIFFGVGWNSRDLGIEAKALAMYAASLKGAAA